MFDFSGSGPEVFGNLNAPRAITLSALIYCLRCLVGRDIPLNQVRGAVLCAGTAAPPQAHITLSEPGRGQLKVGLILGSRWCTSLHSPRPLPPPIVESRPLPSGLPGSGARGNS